MNAEKKLNGANGTILSQEEMMHIQGGGGAFPCNCTTVNGNQHSTMANTIEECLKFCDRKSAEEEEQVACDSNCSCCG